MYKLSNYNYYISYEDKVIYLNGISRQLFSMKKEEHLRLQELFKDLISFEINYTSVFNRFKEWGFILDQNEDEIAILKYRNHRDIYLNRNYRLFINPTLECNLSCWYCYQNHTKGYMNEEIMGKIKKHILYMVEQERINSLNLSWFGGEPLLYFYEIVYPIAMYAKEICDKNHIPYYSTITTNGTKIDDNIVLKMNDIKLKGFQITIDGDEERHNKVRNEEGKSTFKKIINNICLLCQYVEDVHITLRLNYDNQTLARDEIASVFYYIPQEYRGKISVDFQRVWQTRNKVAQENAKRIQLYNICKDLGFMQDGISNIFNWKQNYRCYADRFFHAEINYDGKIYRCTAQGYDDKYVVGKLMDNGVIEWNEKELARRFGRATFDNEHCLICKYLPLCLGPCSQSMLNRTPDQFKEVCYLNNYEISPETSIISNYLQKLDFVKNNN